MINITDKAKCCGCTACYSVCPEKAIEMAEDYEGFLYPSVDMNKCINCGLCEKVCPYINLDKPQDDLEKTFVAYNKDEEIRSKSSSGAMFAAISKVILCQGGIVFGAAYDRNWLVYHKYIDNYKNITELVGSKYLQSRLGDTFVRVKKFLDNDVIVLFIGTTCQIDGLKKYLRKDYENLCTVDFICLGVPSPKVWKAYLDTYFSKSEIQSINFKEKSLGWHTFSLKIKGKKKIYCKNGRRDLYYSGYFKHLYTRASCSNCISKLGNRMSDITISDCWGYDKIAPEMDDNKGMSSVVCHSQKGLEIFEKCKNDIIWKEGFIEDVLKFNSGYNNSRAESPEKENFWRDFNKFSKKKLFKKYCTPEDVKILNKIKRFFLRI